MLKKSIEKRTYLSLIMLWKHFYVSVFICNLNKEYTLANNLLFDGFISDMQKRYDI